MKPKIKLKLTKPELDKAKDQLKEACLALAEKQIRELMKQYPDDAKTLDTEAGVRLLAMKAMKWLMDRVTKKMRKLLEEKRTYNRMIEELFFVRVEVGLFDAVYYRQIKLQTERPNGPNIRFYTRLEKTLRESRRKPLKVRTLTPDERFVASHWHTGVGGMKALSSLPTLGEMCKEASYFGHIITKVNLRATLRSLGYSK